MEDTVRLIRHLKKAGDLAEKVEAPMLLYLIRMALAEAKTMRCTTAAPKPSGEL